MEVTIEEAYAEACRALGEMIVNQRLITNAQRQQAREQDSETP